MLVQAGNKAKELEILLLELLTLVKVRRKYLAFLSQQQLSADKGRLIFEGQEGFFDEYRLYCFRYYYDTKHFREQARENFQKRLEEALQSAE